MISVVNRWFSLLPQFLAFRHYWTPHWVRVAVLSVLLETIELEDNCEGSWQEHGEEGDTAREAQGKELKHIQCVVFGLAFSRTHGHAPRQ